MPVPAATITTPVDSLHPTPLSLVHRYNALFTVASLFLDVIAAWWPAFANVWGLFSLTLLLWLQLPWTDGAALLYDTVTVPYLVPTVSPIVKSFNDGPLVAKLASNMMVNIGYLGAAYFVYFLAPGGLNEFAIRLFATVYPGIVSLVAVGSDGGSDDKQWLAYWPVWTLFSLIVMEVDGLVTIPGWYSLELAGVMYLLLPAFNGATVIFDSVVIPLFELYLSKAAEMDSALADAGVDRRKIATAAVVAASDAVKKME